MNKKYQKYIDYIVNDIDPPYLKSLEPYGLKQDEIDLVLSKLYNQSVTIKGDKVFDNQGKLIYRENSDGYWIKYGYDNDGNQVYREDAVGCWVKQEYDEQGNKLYYEDSSGFIIDYR